MPQSVQPKKRIEEVMSDFKKGKLVDTTGKKISDKEKALAFALKSAGISSDSLVKAEMFNKIQHLRKQVEVKLQKEIAKSETQDSQLIETFAKDKVGVSKIEDIANKLNMSKDEFVEKAFSLLSGFLSEGRGAGRSIEDFDPEEVKMGRLVEQEHTKNPYLIDRIVLDHLSEREDYYSFGKKKGLFDELKKSKGAKRK